MTLALHLAEAPDSALARLEPRCKLVAATVLLLSVASLHHLTPCGAALGVGLLLAWAAGGPWPWLRNRLALLAPILLLMVAALPLIATDTGPAWDVLGVRFSWQGTLAGVRIGAKILTLATLALTLLTIAPATQLYHAARRLRAPRPLLTLVALAYRQTFVLVSELDRLRVALRTRGFRNRADVRSYRLIGNLTGLLLLRSLERAERVGHALRTRRFRGDYPALEEPALQWRDAVGLLAALALATGFVLWDRIL